VSDGPLSREELLSGRIPQHRRAQRVVGSIESRVLYMREETSRALRAYFYGDFSEYQRGLDRDYFAVVRQRAQSETPLVDEDLERFVPQWRMLVPADPELRAAVLHVLGQRLRLQPATTPTALAALGCEDPTVRTTYVDAYGELPEQTFQRTLPASVSSNRTDDEDPILRAVGDRAEWLTVPGGTRLFAAGDPGDALYLVVSGRFRVVQSTDGGDEFIAEIGRGEIVGEMGALTGEPRSADVLAARDSEVIHIPQDLLMEVAATAPEVLLRINRDLVTRLRNTTAGVSTAPRASTYAIVATSPDAPVREVARRLAEAMRGIGATIQITRSEVERRSNPEAGDGLPVFNDPQLIAWLGEQESSHRYVLYEADAELTPWTRRCIRQADRVLLVANAAADPSPGAIDEEISIAGSRPDIELLLVHPESTERPTGTARWLNQRTLQAHHHLRLGDDAQLRHVARLITGTALGLAFGGGGARGAAHLGIVQALSERGIEVDVIGGTSMGAIMGGRLATGLTAAEVTKRLTDVIASQGILDWTLPIVGLTSGANANSILFGEFASLRIEDLWRPFFCVSTNLTRADAIIHRSGSLWTAVRASISIPGVFPPVISGDGDLLVDGGIMNNLPIDLVRQSRGIGTVIGSSVAPDRELEDDFRYGSTASGWRIALSRLPGIGPRINAPSILSTLMRSNDVRGVALARTAEFAAQADLIVQSPVEGFPTLDFTRSAELAEIGYRAANEAFEEWDGIDALVRLNSTATPGNGTTDVAR
jgi:predicted acylesterase/phospholipase RssA/CRP-like cAMP-binding protein